MSSVDVGRPPKRFRVTGLACGAFVVALLLLPVVSAGPLATWSPAYSGSLYAPTPTYTTLGAGANSFAYPQAFGLSTGTATFEVSSTASGGGSTHSGWYAANGVIAGLQLSQYSCNLPCSTGSHTVTFFWNVTWSWSESGICASTPGGTSGALVYVVLEGRIVNAGTGTQMANATTVLSNPTAFMSCTGTLSGTSGGSSSALSTTVIVAASLVSGTSYIFESFVQAGTAAEYCYGGSCPTATSADYYTANVDFVTGSNSGVLSTISLV